MRRKKASKGGVDGSGLYRLGAELNAAELARFGLKCRTPDDGIMALPYTDKREAKVGDWFVYSGDVTPDGVAYMGHYVLPDHAFRLLTDLTGKGAVGIRAARLVRTKRTVTYTIVPDNDT